MPKAHMTAIIRVNYFAEALQYTKLRGIDVSNLQK